MVMQFHRTASIKGGACLINDLFASLPVQKGHADAFFSGYILGRLAKSVLDIVSCTRQLELVFFFSVRNLVCNRAQETKVIRMV